MHSCLLLLRKILTFCLHSPTKHTQTPPFAHMHTLCPTASQGWEGLACKCFPGGSCSPRVLRPRDGSRWRLERNQFFFLFLFFACSLPSPPPLWAQAVIIMGGDSSPLPSVPTVLGALEPPRVTIPPPLSPGRPQRLLHMLVWGFLWIFSPLFRQVCFLSSLQTFVWI